MNPVSVLLVDDSQRFLDIATNFLRVSSRSEVSVVGRAQGGREALTKAQQLRPQVILIDLAMPDLPGLEAIPRLRTMLPDAVIIALTMMDQKSYQEAALEAGADEFVSKDMMGAQLLPAIHRVMQRKGGVVISEGPRHSP